MRQGEWKKRGALGPVNRAHLADVVLGNVFPAVCQRTIIQFIAFVSLRGVIWMAVQSTACVITDGCATSPDGLGTQSLNLQSIHSDIH